jgi:predicted HicB family RNase H-like nuclease
MEMARFVAGLEADLAAVAAVGDEQTAAAAERLIQAVRGSAGLRLLDALGQAALEVSEQLPAGHVEVRVSGQDPSFVYVAEEETEPESAPDDGLTARITLRLPEALKASVEAAAAREGISVNSWLVRALSRSTAPRVQRSGNRLRGFAQS